MKEKNTQFKYSSSLAFSHFVCNETIPNEIFIVKYQNVNSRLLLLLRQTSYSFMNTFEQDWVFHQPASWLI